AARPEVGARNPAPTIDLPISRRGPQIVFCSLVACPGGNDAFEATPKPLPMWNISHSPPPPPPGRGSERGASRTAVVIVSGDGWPTGPAPKISIARCAGRVPRSLVAGPVRVSRLPCEFDQRIVLIELREIGLDCI